jgi:hypothetical protein
MATIVEKHLPIPATRYQHRLLHTAVLPNLIEYLCKSGCVSRTFQISEVMYEYFEELCSYEQKKRSCKNRDFRPRIQ